LHPVMSLFSSSIEILRAGGRIGLGVPPGVA
jgi:hypothetical protein